MAAASALVLAALLAGCASPIGMLESPTVIVSRPAPIIPQHKPVPPPLPNSTQDRMGRLDSIGASVDELRTRLEKPK